MKEQLVMQDPDRTHPTIIRQLQKQQGRRPLRSAVTQWPEQLRAQPAAPTPIRRDALGREPIRNPAPDTSLEPLGD